MFSLDVCGEFFFQPFLKNGFFENFKKTISLTLKFPSINRWRNMLNEFSDFFSTNFHPTNENLLLLMSDKIPKVFLSSFHINGKSPKVHQHILSRNKFSNRRKNFLRFSIARRSFSNPFLYLLEALCDLF